MLKQLKKRLGIGATDEVDIEVPDNVVVVAEEPEPQATPASLVGLLPAIRSLRGAMMCGDVNRVRILRENLKPRMRAVPATTEQCDDFIRDVRHNEFSIATTGE